MCTDCLVRPRWGGLGLQGRAAGSWGGWGGGAVKLFGFIIKGEVVEMWMRWMVKYYTMFVLLGRATACGVVPNARLKFEVGLN